MVIKNNRNTMVEFGSLNNGDVFIHYGEDVCMKIALVKDEIGIYFNTVNLTNGTLDCCNDDTMVQPIKCELVID